MSVSSYFSSKPAPITAVLDESPSWSWIDLRATSLIDWMLDLLAFLVGITSPAWKSCYTDEDINYNTSTSTIAALFPATPDAPPPQAPPPSGPITRARARELNIIMLLKNEGPEE
jgi:hypothetical protein